MVQANVKDVQHARDWSFRTYLREINDRLRKLAFAVNFNDGDRWDDLRFPAAALPSGPNSPTPDGTHGTWLFQAPSGPIESVFAQVQMPHAWREFDAYIVPHVHWTKTTTGTGGDVHWQCEYKHYDIGAVGDAGWTAISGETTVGGTPDNDTAQEHLITRCGEIDMTARTISDMLLMKVSRIAATGTEYTANAQMLEFDIHYKIDSRGSIGEFDKDGV